LSDNESKGTSQENVSYLYEKPNPVNEVEKPRENDLLVISGGPGGYVCAIQGSQIGLKTILIEKARLGGECLIAGCIPSKSLISVAKAYDKVHEGQKYVGKEAGLSRLKTHRIVARFAERGIVTVKPLGNTNEVTVSDWVQGSKAPN
jgi:pyruvate/2-oxoglutarate dehydrogenase complex dihydrolipoamide dehydrogenase (E3) component